MAINIFFIYKCGSRVEQKPSKSGGDPTKDMKKEARERANHRSMIFYDLRSGWEIMMGRVGGHQGHGNRKMTRLVVHDCVKFYAIIPIFLRRIITFLAQFSRDLCAPGSWAFGEDNEARIHDIFHLFLYIHSDDAQPVLR